MAHTITDRAHGAVDCNEARFSLPSSSRASMYFISPARPEAIHASKWRNSAKSPTGATPASSKPALRAVFFTRAVIWLIWGNGHPIHYPSLGERMPSSVCGTGTPAREYGEFVEDGRLRPSLSLFFRTPAPQGS